MSKLLSWTWKHLFFCFLHRNQITLFNNIFSIFGTELDGNNSIFLCWIQVVQQISSKDKDLKPIHLQLGSQILIHFWLLILRWHSPIAKILLWGRWYICEFSCLLTAYPLKEPVKFSRPSIFDIYLADLIFTKPNVINTTIKLFIFPQMKSDSIDAQE